MAFIVRLRTQSAFRQFISNQQTQVLAANLLQFYQLNGGWDNVDRILPEIAIWVEPDSDDEEIRRNWKRLALAGADGVIIYSLDDSEIGNQVTTRELERSTRMVINGHTIGYLIATPTARAWASSSPEGRFLTTVNGAAIISGVVAVGLALALGSLLAHTMTRSLRELTDATVSIAGGTLGEQVEVRSQDELGELALSFNKMSADLARSTSARRQMTADIAHDLRSPLSVIAGYAEALNDGKLPGTPEVYDILHKETQQLNRLIDDLRTLSLADAGELSLNIQPVEPNEFLERVEARHRITAEEKGIRLTTAAPEGLPPVQMDPERMSQVIDNLIANAFRHTPAGGDVRMSVEVEDRQAVFRIKDTGSGISAEDLPHIFNRFYRGDKSRHSGDESGLGLAIARSIVTAQGGSIRVSSHPGSGAEFIISLPLVSRS